jgi:hypothetical protein
MMGFGDAHDLPPEFLVVHVEARVNELASSHQFDVIHPGFF